MANTVIALKKSSTPSAIPSNLANGELAINFADGKLYYKNTTSSIVEISPTILSFGTVSANGTLLVADTVGDILTIEAGNNITIVGDAINDKVTIGLSNNLYVPGNVGIGTTTPTANLHVIGTANITNTIFLTGGSTTSGDINLTSSSLTVRTPGMGGSYSFAVKEAGTNYFQVSSVFTSVSGALGIGVNSPSPTAWIARDANDILGQRNVTSPTNPQTYRLYGTYTDTSNYERIRISANTTGHYIIGEEAGTGSARPLYLGANNTTAVTIDTAGNVGIGTTSPISKLHIVHASASPSTNGLRISDSGGVNSGVTLGRNGSDGYFEILGQNDVYGLRFRTNGTATNRFVVDIGGNVSATGSFSTTSGSLLNGLSTAFYVSAGTPYDSGIQFRNGSNGSKSAVQPDNGALTFYTNANNTNFDSSMIRMVIGSNGNVGIGATSPAAKLDVTTNGSTAGFRVYNGSLTYMAANGGTPFYWDNNGLALNSAVGTSYLLYVNGASYYGGRMYLQSSIDFTTAGGEAAKISSPTTNVLVFSNSLGENMRITSDGNVGIGTTTPTQRLTLIGPGYGYAQTSGTSQLYGAFRIASPGTTGILDFGIGASGTNQWIQSGDTNLAFSYSLLLNPTGGNVGIGITSATAKLTVANGTSPTSQHNYGTYTDVSNYERINLTANSSGHYIIGEKAGTGSARPLYLGANNTTVVTVNSDKSVVVKDKLYGRSSADHVTYSIYEASIDSVYIANDSSRSGIGYPIQSLYIGGLADGRDAFRLNSNTIYLGAKTTVFRTQANPNTTNWISGGSFSVTSNPGSDNFAFGIDDNRTYGWLQYWSGGTATNISINPLGGNVGIGTVTPGAKLEVASPGAGGANLRLPGPSSDNNWAGGIRFYSYDATTVRNEILNSTNGMWFNTNNAERMRISAAGLVGIGIASPAYKLDVAGPASFPYNIASFTDGTTRGITLKTSTNGYTNMRLFDGGGRNITITSQPNDLTTADNYLAAIAQGIGSGVSLSTAVNVDSNYMTLRARGDIAFYTNLGSTDLLERMRVAADGNIGINTTLPTEKLQVEGNVIINGNLAIGTTTDYNCVFKLNNDIEIATNKVAATNANTQTVISTFSADKYRGGKFTILGKNANDSHITELLLTHNFTNVFYTEYGVVYSNTSLYTVSSSIVSNNVQIVLNSALPDIHYDIMENKFVDIGVYDRSQTITLDRSGSIIEIRAA